MVLRGPLPDGVDLGLVVVGEVRTGEADGGGGDDGVGGGLDIRDSDGDVRLPWKNRGIGNFSFFFKLQVNKSTFVSQDLEWKQERCKRTYVAVRGSAAGEDSGVAFAVGRGLQALPCLDLCQQLRVVSGGGHHVEGFSACREKDGDGK